MVKKIFISAILLIAVLSFVVSLLGGKNNSTVTVSAPVKSSQIAVIDISGAIESSGEGEDSFFSETRGASSGRIMADLRNAAKDTSVKAVLLRINSPGGSVTAAEEITRELKRFKETSKKPIVATFGDTAASAAYYIASPCDKIYANASTLTGSIGVYIGSMNVEELYKKIGLDSVMIKSGVHKDILSPTRTMTPEEKDILQSMVNEMYEQFIQTVSEGRKLPLDTVRALADGRVYSGAQGKNLGLVDEIGNYYDALDGTAALAGMDASYEVLQYKNERSWRSLFGAEIEEAIGKAIIKSLKAQGGLKETLTPRAER